MPDDAVSPSPVSTPCQHEWTNGYCVKCSITRTALVVLFDLRDRLAEKEPLLREMAEKTRNQGEYMRLSGKAEGVLLALSFIEEAIDDQEAQRA